ncbi:MAG: flagellar protein FlaG [Nitrospirae bacterium]|nr:MAG: flagellar protein FlaG [Nitrospirota bacterium]
MEEFNVIRSVGYSASSVARSFPSPLSSVRSGEGKSAEITNSSREPGAASQKPSPPVETSQVEAAVATLNSQLKLANHALRFRVDDVTDQIIVSVIDKETGEVIRQIPPEVSVRLAASRELSGLFETEG